MPSLYVIIGIGVFLITILFAATPFLRSIRQKKRVEDGYEKIVDLSTAQLQQRRRCEFRSKIK